MRFMVRKVGHLYVLFSKMYSPTFNSHFRISSAIFSMTNDARDITHYNPGLVLRPFPIPSQENRYKTFRAFSTLIIDEASQISYSYLFPIFYHVYRSFQPDNLIGLCSRMVYMSGPFPFIPNASRPPSIYTAIIKCSFFERFTFKGIPTVQGKENCAANLSQSSISYARFYDPWETFPI